MVSAGGDTQCSAMTCLSILASASLMMLPLQQCVYAALDGLHNMSFCTVASASVISCHVQRCYVLLLVSTSTACSCAVITGYAGSDNDNSFNRRCMQLRIYGLTVSDFGMGAHHTCVRRGRCLCTCCQQCGTRGIVL